MEHPERIPENPMEGFDPQVQTGFRDAVIEMTVSPMLQEDRDSYDGLMSVMRDMRRLYPDASDVIIYARMAASVYRVMTGHTAYEKPEERIERLCALLVVGMLREDSRP